MATSAISFPIVGVGTSAGGLEALNQELQHRNELLTEMNNDLNNLLNTVCITLVGSDLSVRRFSPQAAEILGLNAHDVGRPISRLRLKVDVKVLEDALLEVMKSVQSKHYRVQTQDGRWCNLRLSPYRTLDNRIEGVVLAIFTVEELSNMLADSRGNAHRKAVRKPLPKKSGKRRQS